MTLLHLLLALAPIDADANLDAEVALNQWRTCTRESAGHYAELSASGAPQETGDVYVEAHCWKHRASAMLALEPVARAALAARGITTPPMDVVGMLVGRILDRERDKL